ncbi:MAG TPA: hypothetical protein VHV09_09925 [Trebonia sp.]|jgi:hypothetical protein|nr:hypothetical protein [Trebonia sp.]
MRGVRPALAALAAGALIAVVGCSSGSSSSAGTATATAAPSATAAASGTASGAASGTGGSSPAALPTASMTPLAGASGQLTGTQLESVLLPQSDFPAGFATPTSGPVSSGGSLTSGAATYDLATVSCATFIEHFGTTGFGETAMVFGSVGASGQAYDQLIYQFAAAPGASAFLSGVQSLAGRCGSFTASANGQSGTFSLKATSGSPVGGHPTVELQETGSLNGSKVALDLLLAASGVDVFGAGGAGANGAAAPAQVAKESIVYQLMKRQAAAAVLG